MEVPPLVDSGVIMPHQDLQSEVSWSYDQLACDASYTVKMSVTILNSGAQSATRTENLPFNFNSELLSCCLLFFNLSA